MAVILPASLRFAVAAELVPSLLAPQGEEEEVVNVGLRGYDGVFLPSPPPPPLFPHRKKEMTEMMKWLSVRIQLLRDDCYDDIRR